MDPPQPISPAKPSKTKRKTFCRFDLTEAYKHLNLTQLPPWDLHIQAIVLSDFCQQRLTKLHRFFDLSGYEESQKLLQRSQRDSPQPRRLWQ